MKEIQRGFIPLIVAIVLGLAAIGGGVAVMVAHQDTGRNETSITNSSDTQTAAAAASAVALSGDASEKPVASPEATVVESKQKEAEVEYVTPITVSGFGGSGGTVYGYAPVKVEQEQEQSQPTISHPTTAQMAGVLVLCADVRIADICNQTFWDGYMTNAIFRSEVDVLVIRFQHLNEQARLTAQLQQQTNCAAWMDAISPLLAGMSPEASVNAQKSSMATCSGEGYDDTAYKLEEIQEDVDELKKIACPLGSSDINCQLMQ